MCKVEIWVSWSSASTLGCQNSLVNFKISLIISSSLFAFRRNFRQKKRNLNQKLKKVSFTANAVGKTGSKIIQLGQNAAIIGWHFVRHAFIKWSIAAIVKAAISLINNSYLCLPTVRHTRMWAKRGYGLFIQTLREKDEMVHLKKIGFP